MYDLSGKRVLVTGGAGFVGSFIADQLLDEGVKEIIVFDNLVRGSLSNIESALGSGKVKFVEGDIRNIQLLDKLFQDIDYCFHMAALRITRCTENNREAMEVMYNGAFNILEACVEHDVKKLVVASSASIYGTADSFPTNEHHHPYNNRTLYGAAKLANELLLRSFNDMHSLDYIALRYFNIYGPRMDIEGKYTEVMIRWYHLIKDGKPPVIFGDGKQTMDFVYVEDVAKASILALKTPVADQVFNVARGIETSLEELCWLLIEVMGSNVKPKYIPLPDDRKNVEVVRRWADVSNARKLLQFEASVSLKAGLEKLVAWISS